ncbi:MAG: DNA polymerase III subunit alpha [Nitrospirae bacterium]|nr:DNA polymerase III subunit alpha [Nitrospirota bacterium]
MHPHSDYVPLHVHTEYSLLDGALKIDELTQLASLYRMPAVAMTDHGNLFGAIEFYKKVAKAGLKPIIGCEVYVAPKSRFDKDKTEMPEASFHLILLAKDNNGYKNLVKLVTKAYTEGFYYKPRIDRALLGEHSGGLIGLTACLKGEVPYYLQRGMAEKARETALEYRNILGPENFYIEIQNNNLAEQEKVNIKLVELAKELDLGITATNDCHYLKKEDARAHDILLCIQTGKTIKDDTRLKFTSDGFYFKSPEEMKAFFKELPEAVLNTRAIAEKCNVDFKLGGTLLPEYQTETGISPESLLETKAKEGLFAKFGSHPPDIYIERFRKEIETIKKMGYSSYFLIVWDFISFARKNGIPVGPGRGSAAGSLVSYCLDITELDPLKYNLLFERFLNPERVSMPDIDVDFCKDRREEVISYVSEKYGKEHVAQIITFGTMAAKAAIRDVGRAMDIPYAEVDRIAKLVPDTLKIKIEDAIKTEPQLKDLYENNPKVKELLDIAKRLEGLCRHASTHAAGVVISPAPLTNYMPLYRTPGDNTITTQLDMEAVESIGLLKFDFLGLKTLTIIDKTQKYLKDSGTEIAFENIPLNDADTYALLSSGHTTGIFQLESSGMREILLKMQPNRFEDLIALVALYRPGPIGSGMIDEFIKRKKGLIPVKNDLPQLKEILDETYGVILYQEQVMQIANRLANFTLGQADILRKAMGKKTPEEMEKMKEAFIKGAVSNKISEKKAKKIFDLMALFAEYGFNKSHSAAYAYLAYETAYLKTHYPVEFMAANLSAGMDNTDKVMQLISECRNMSIKVLPPDINESGREFKVIGNSIRFGLEAVKGVGAAAIESIIYSKGKNGSFLSIEDFFKKADTKKVNKKVLENLIKAGAFDSLGITRAKAMSMASDFLNGATSLSLLGQQNIFSSEDEYGKTKEWDEMELLTYEKEALGFYITGHPLMKYREQLSSLNIKPIGEISDFSDREEVRVAGVINSIKRIQKRGTAETMAYFILDDEEGSLEAIAFPELYRNNAKLLRKDAIIIVRGVIDHTEKGIKLISNEITEIDSLISKNGFKCEISIKYSVSEDLNLRELRQILTDNSGKYPLYIKVDLKDLQVFLATELKIEPSALFTNKVEGLLGKGAMRIVNGNQ